MEVLDSLPYIDPVISQADREKAEALLNSDVPRTKKIHPSLKAAYEPKFSELFTKELDRLKAGKPREGGIDTSRYEASEDLLEGSDIEAWKAALQIAYANRTYLEGRTTNITLLEEYGKNAWLIGNSQLETMLHRLEADLARTKAQTENVNRERKAAQEGSSGELQGLEDAWKRGIGNVIESQVATNNLQQELANTRRNRRG